MAKAHGNAIFAHQILDLHFMTLFKHTDTYLYGLGTCPSGVCLVKSLDQGRTWTNSSVIVAGKFAGGANPVLYANGFLYRALEATGDGGGWPREFKATVISVNASHDIMNPSAWQSSNSLPFDPTWIKGTPWDSQEWTAPGYLEGNPVVTATGQVYNLLRVNSLPYANVACLLKLSGPGGNLSFSELIPFPGGMSKFDIK